MSVTYFDGPVQASGVLRSFADSNQPIILFRKNFTYGATSTKYKQIRQATIKNVYAVHVSTRGTSASVVKGQCFFSWRQINSSVTSRGSTLRIYGYRGATGMSSATRGASASMIIVGV